MAFYTGTAVINWFDGNGGLHIRVYETDGDNITERCTDAGGSGWTAGSFKQQGSSVSATVWTQNGEPNIRVYCINEGAITEWCNGPNGWYQGQFTPA